MIVACVALIVALGGTSYAVTQLPNNSVGTPQLKKGAVTSLKIKDGTIIGADVNKSKLGKVPSAARADSAANANTLNGKSSTSFLHSKPSPHAQNGPGPGPSHRHEQ